MKRCSMYTLFDLLITEVGMTPSEVIELLEELAESSAEPRNE